MFAKNLIWLMPIISVIIAQNYRLPKNVIPEQYDLSIITYLGVPNNFSFDGAIAITVECLKPTTSITLHSNNLEIDKEEISVKDISDNEKTIEITEINLDKQYDFIIIQLKESLTQGHKYKIFIPFRGKLDDGLAGFYRSSYLDKDTKEKHWLGVTQFEAISARKAFPCFDEPDMKARFKINLGRKDGYTSLSNMPLKNTKPMKEKEGWFWDEFENSVPMSTYLVAFIVSDFGYKTAKQGKSNVTFNIWARKDALDQVDFAKEIGPKCLEFYEEYFGIKYPLPKQDMAAIPDFSAGAMENWGLITFRENYLLYDPEISSTVNQHSIVSVIAHELAHQWFGNLVTMKWWTDLWLNEGFATYMAGLTTDHLYPQWNSLEEEASSDLLRVFSFDSLISSHPVSVPIGDPNEIDEIFDTISYKKGSFLIRMMGKFLGDEILRKGVSNYLEAHKYQNAEQDDLWESLTDEAKKHNVLQDGLTVKKIMDSWTVQTGYPVVTIDRNYGNNTAFVCQKRYLRDTSEQNTDHNACWWVPLSYTSESEKNFNRTIPKKWLSCPHSPTQEVIETGNENEWIIANIRSAGLYRVNYDEKNWQLITKFLQSESYRDIPTINRVQLIDDSADLGWVGELKYDVFFNLLEYLKFENEYLPWKSALANIGELRRLMRLSPGYGNFKAYIQQVVKPIYGKIGGFILKKSADGKLDNVKHQILITSWACKFDIENCVSDARGIFNQWKSKSGDASGDTASIPKDFRNIIYCNVLRQGGEEEWNLLWQRYLKSNVAAEKSSILSSLGCTKEMWLLSRYLDWSINDTSGIRRQDTASVFSAVVSNDIGYYIAKDWLYNNFKEVHKHLAPNSRRISRFLSSLAHEMSTENDLREFKNFIEENKTDLSEVKQGVEQALETVKLNVQWQQNRRRSVEQVLQKYTAKE